MKIPKIETKERKTYDKPNYFIVEPGRHIIRLLDKEGGAFHITEGHWLGRGYVECLGSECPVCESNAEIRRTKPNDYNRDSNYSAKRTLFYVNVLDRTPVKVCPNCQTENKKNLDNVFPPACLNRGCGAFLTEVEPTPSNKVKVLSRGQELLDMFRDINFSILDGEGEPVGIENFDVLLSVNDQKRPTAIPLADRKDEVNVPADALFDLETVILQLERDDLIEYMSGTSLRDIFASKRDEDEGEDDLDIDDVIKDDVADLFEN